MWLILSLFVVVAGSSSLQSRDGPTRFIRSEELIESGHAAERIAVLDRGKRPGERRRRGTEHGEGR